MPPCPWRPLMRSTPRTIAAMLCAFALSACASTPKEAVQLSVTVGRDVEAVHVAHVALAKRYFDRMEAEVNAFVDKRCRPYAIDDTMKSRACAATDCLASRLPGPGPAGWELAGGSVVNF